MTVATIKMRLLSLLVLICGGVVVWLLPAAAATPPPEYLTVHFFDVGQGDATFIETPDGAQVLIDGGPNNSVLHELAQVMPLRDRSIDVVIATHPDSDHIGGLIDVFERYVVDAIMLTENKSDSTTAVTYERLVSAEGAEILYARRGQILTVGASTTLEILWPETDPTAMESNESSIVLKLSYGDTSFMLTGDSPKRIEEYLVLAEGEHLMSTVLKVGHHGSRTSTSELFLAEVRPEYAVLSYGADNRYGHPHVEVTDALFNARVETLSTAEQGTVTFYSDGENVWVD